MKASRGTIADRSRLTHSSIGRHSKWYSNCPFFKKRVAMHMNNTEVITVLKNLIETSDGGQEIFRAAAENIHNSEFRRLFNIFAQQRAQFASELKAEVHRLGGEPGT